MRTTWKGYLKFSLVTIPVRMYSAVSRKAIHFNLLHNECRSRVRQHNYCPRCERELEKDDIIRGYQYGKESYITVTDEELERAKKESTNAIEILRFVDDRQIAPVYYSDANYLVPDGEVGVEAFTLFHRAIGSSGKAALARVVMRNKEYLLSIKPYDGALVAYTLHYPEEIQDIGQLEEARKVAQAKVDRETLSMASQIINNLSGDFRPEELVDEYSESLMELIKAKAEGKEYAVEREERRKVINLMDALKRSVKDTKGIPKKELAATGIRKRAEKKRKTA